MMGDGTGLLPISLSNRKASMVLMMERPFIGCNVRSFCKDLKNFAQRYQGCHEDLQAQ